MSRALTWFGDDFTGSSDVLLQYTRAGIPALLFMRTPTVADLDQAGRRYDALGIAGITRALPVDRIGPVVREAFHRLAELDPLVVQYKICSTADSSPEVGSIAPPLQAGRELFGEVPVPILPAQPDLGRYTLFGNHFGRDATGIHRLDRLPAMANHPVTPMAEADLRIHFAAQLDQEVGGIDLTTLRAGDGAEALGRLAAAGMAAYVVDAIDNDDLLKAAELLLAGSGNRVFAIGSGGLSTGIAAARGGDGTGPAARPPSGEAPSACLVVSGSASGRTSEQIDQAIAAGWTAIPLDPARLGSADHFRGAVDDVARAALDAFDHSRGVVVYTAHHTLLPPSDKVASDTVGAALGEVVLAARRHLRVPRVVVAGGDTSGYVLTRLKAETLSAVGTVGDDLVLGTVTSADNLVDGVEVVLKGGQLGTADVFDRALHVAT